jgi:hypothetical protein
MYVISVFQCDKSGSTLITFWRKVVYGSITYVNIKMSFRIVWQKGIDISEENVVSIFRKEGQELLSCRYLLSNKAPHHFKVVYLFLLLPFGAFGIRETLVSLQFLNLRQTVELLAER